MIRGSGGALMRDENGFSGGSSEAEKLLTDDKGIVVGPLGGRLN